MTRKGRRQARRAYHARMQARLERMPEDVAWSCRGASMLHYLVTAEDERRSNVVQFRAPESWSVRV